MQIVAGDEGTGRYLFRLMRQRDRGKGFTGGEEPGTLASMVLERSTVGSLTHAELVDLVIRQSEWPAAS